MLKKVVVLKILFFLFLIEEFIKHSNNKTIE